MLQINFPANIQGTYPMNLWLEIGDYLLQADAVLSGGVLTIRYGAALKQYHGTPISKKLASNFIELGYGLQTDGMASEMFFNRSFEPFYPYRMINKLWFDLLDDENDLSSRCETDWRKFDWCHSGYEHNAWFAFPARLAISR